MKEIHRIVTRIIICSFTRRQMNNSIERFSRSGLAVDHTIVILRYAEKKNLDKKRGKK